jgi:hypothetical protein
MICSSLNRLLFIGSAPFHRAELYFSLVPFLGVTSTPADRLARRHLEIFAARDKKLDAARQNRKLKRQQLT